jgi:hypothetical protein
MRIRGRIERAIKRTYSYRREYHRGQQGKDFSGDLRKMRREVSSHKS